MLWECSGVCQVFSFLCKPQAGLREQSHKIHFSCTFYESLCFKWLWIKEMSLRFTLRVSSPETKQIKFWIMFYKSKSCFHVWIFMGQGSQGAHYPTGIVVNLSRTLSPWLTSLGFTQRHLESSPLWHVQCSLELLVLKSCGRSTFK